MSLLPNKLGLLINGGAFALDLFFCVPGFFRATDCLR